MTCEAKKITIWRAIAISCASALVAALTIGFTLGIDRSTLGKDVEKNTQEIKVMKKIQSQDHDDITGIKVDIEYIRKWVENQENK